MPGGPPSPGCRDSSRIAALPTLLCFGQSSSRRLNASPLGILHADREGKEGPPGASATSGGLLGLAGPCCEPLRHRGVLLHAPGVRGPSYTAALQGGARRCSMQRMQHFCVFQRLGRSRPRTEKVSRSNTTKAGLRPSCCNSQILSIGLGTSTSKEAKAVTPTISRCMAALHGCCGMAGVF